MPFDGIAIRAMVEELNSMLLDTVLIKYTSRKKTNCLNYSSSPPGNPSLVDIGQCPLVPDACNGAEKTNPSTPPSFCMLLRKYLEGEKSKALVK